MPVNYYEICDNYWRAPNGAAGPSARRGDSCSQPRIARIELKQLDFLSFIRLNPPDPQSAAYSSSLRPPANPPFSRASTGFCEKIYLTRLWPLSIIRKRYGQGEIIDWSVSKPYEATVAFRPVRTGRAHQAGAGGRDTRVSTFVCATWSYIRKRAFRSRICLCFGASVQFTLDLFYL